MGFLIFMYLVTRGFPIKRIAFLSAYINECDSEYAQKVELLNKLSQQEKWKKRTAHNDKELRQYATHIPSLEKKIIRILESEKIKGIVAYEKVCSILKHDTETTQGTVCDTEIDETLQKNERYFNLLEQTGIKVDQKINKSEEDKLIKWILSETSEELGNFYALRYEILNICDSVKNLEPLIYEIYKNNNDFKKNYPKNYFENLIEKIKYEVCVFGEDKDIILVCETILNNMVAFWENLDKTYIKGSSSGENPSDKDFLKDEITNHAMTMVLKNTRNWYAHGRIQGVDIEFCEFIFLLSIRIIYGPNADVAEYVHILHDYEEEIENQNIKYRSIWEKINEKIIAHGSLHTNTYTINLTDLYYKYSHEKVRSKIQLTKIDLIEMFILCLHFPSLKKLEASQSFEVEFRSIDYTTQELYIVELERMALNYKQ